VVKAIQDAAGRFLHICGADFYYEGYAALLERLATLAPGTSKKRVFLSNSGAEAVEGAIKLARHSTGRPALIAFNGAFHGRTYGAMTLTASKAVQRAGFAPFVPEVYHVPYGYRYRCDFCRGEPACTMRCVSSIEADLFARRLDPKSVAAVFVEPVAGDGGCPVCCAAALATLDIVTGELLPNVQRMGERLLAGVRRLEQQHAAIGEVRGLGLMIGIEFVKDRATREPAPELVHDLVVRAFRKGLLLLGAGKSSLRLAPPLVIDEYDVDTALRIIDECLAELTD